MSREQFAAGDPVQALKTAFTGHLLSPHTGGIFSYYRSDTDQNVAVWAVEDRETGEVRFFRRDALTYRD